MIEILNHHIQTHPHLLPQDAVKFCYQSAFGGGHLITDAARAANYLSAERAALTPNTNIPAYEPLGNGLVRLNLASADVTPLSDAAILRVFAGDAAHVLAREDNDKRFSDLLGMLETLAAQGRTSFTADELAAYLTEYRAEGCPTVSHTDAYRTAYAPAYRVIEEASVRLLPLIDRIESLLAANADRTAVIAIDGHAASGKTTLAAQLSALYDCNVFHMDDYFLPFDKRTAARLAQPGGNVDYERFKVEVLDAILAGEDVTYSAFDCSAGTFLPPVTVQRKSTVIVEGSYAHHPYFEDAYDLRIALDITEDEQRRRILARNGEQMLRMFVERWIPMEHRYFEAFHIFENADMKL